MSMVILGLGTNIGDRRQHLRDAVAALKKLLGDIRCSPVYESPALLPQNAPQEWDLGFLNMAVRGETALDPLALLTRIKKIERAQGRIARGHWGPREIDIDILAYGNDITTRPELDIPHRELLRRDFALIPLADLAPDWVHPLAEGKTARQLAIAMHSNLTKTDGLYD